MKSYFKIFDFGRSLFIYVLTEMSVLLRTHFKQNFKTILWRPYSEVAKTPDSLSWPVSHALCSHLHAETWEVWWWCPLSTPRPQHTQERWLHQNKTQAHTVPLFIKVAHGSLQLSCNTPEGWNGKLIPLDINFKTEELSSWFLFSNLWIQH